MEKTNEILDVDDLPDASDLPIEEDIEYSHASFHENPTAPLYELLDTIETNVDLITTESSQDVYYYKFERLRTILSILRSKLHRFSEFNTSLKALKDTKDALSIISDVLQEITNEVNERQWEVINEYTDNLFEVAPLIASANLRETEDLYSEIYEAKQELNAQINRANSTIGTLEDYHQKTVTRFEETLRSLLDKQQQEFSKFTIATDKSAVEFLDQLKKYAGDGAQHAHYLSGRVLSGFFADRADAEKRAAWFWTAATWVSVSLILLSVVVFIILHYRNVIDARTLEPSILAAKFLFTLTLGLIAKWTSKRATRHLTEESKYHRLAINMKTIDAYIEKLDPASKDEILKAAAFSIFTEAKANEAQTDYEAVNVAEVLKGLLNPKS